MGGSSSTESVPIITTSSGPTSAQLIAQRRAICYPESAADMDADAFRERWLNPLECAADLSKRVYGETNTGGLFYTVLDGVQTNTAARRTKFDLDSFNSAADDIKKAMGLIDIGAPSGSVGYSRISDVFYQICMTEPGLCHVALNNYCRLENVSHNRVVTNTRLRQFCGCRLPDSAYDSLSDTFGIQRECTPYCNSQDVVPALYDDGLDKRLCSDTTRTICVIDSLAISTPDIDSSAQISQICSNCGPGGTCSCYIENSSIFATGSVDVSQSCSSTRCFKNDNGVIVETECPDISVDDEDQIPVRKISIAAIILMSILLIALFLR